MEQFKRTLGYTFVQGVGQLDTSGEDVEQVLLQLPLEGVIEPVTAIKVAIALGRQFGVDASVAQPENLRTLEAIAALVEQLRTAQSAVTSPAPSARQVPAAPAPTAPAPAPTAQPVTTVQRSIALRQEARRVVMDTVVAKTGYPEDMLELDLDMEADLGIDTVKQVDIFSRAREAFGVSRDPNRALRDFNTLRKVIDYIVERALAAQPSAPAPAPTPAPPPAPVAARPPAPAPVAARPPAVPTPAPVKPAVPPAATAGVPTSIAASLNLAAQVREVLLRTVVAKTGYPEDMLELDLDMEADLGIDTVKQVDIFSRTREAFGVSRDPNRALRDFNTLRKVIDYIVERALAAQPSTPTPAPTPAPPPAAAPVAAPQRASGAPRSVREALLAMDLRQVGMKGEELNRLGEALASRLGAPTPDTGKVRTLGELVQHLRKDR